MAMATDMNQFMSQAQNYIKTAKDRGVPDNKIANTIRFMYSVTQQNIANNAANKENLGSIDYNADTGEYYNTLPGGSADVGTYSSPMADTSISASDFGLGQPGPQVNQSPATKPSNRTGELMGLAQGDEWRTGGMSTPEPNMSTESGPAYAQPTPQSKSSDVYKSGIPTLDFLSGKIFGQSF